MKFAQSLVLSVLALNFLACSRPMAKKYEAPSLEQQIQGYWELKSQVDAKDEVPARMKFETKVVEKAKISILSYCGIAGGNGEVTSKVGSGKIEFEAIMGIVQGKLETKKYSLDVKVVNANQLLVNGKHKYMRIVPANKLANSQLCDPASPAKPSAAPAPGSTGQPQLSLPTPPVGTAPAAPQTSVPSAPIAPDGSDTMQPLPNDQPSVPDEP